MTGNSNDDVEVSNFIAQPDASLGPGMEDYFAKEKTEFEDQDESINLEVGATVGMKSIGHGSYDYHKENLDHEQAHSTGTNFAFDFNQP